MRNKDLYRLNVPVAEGGSIHDNKIVFCDWSSRYFSYSNCYSRGERLHLERYNHRYISID